MFEEYKVLLRTSLGENAIVTAKHGMSLLVVERKAFGMEKTVNKWKETRQDKKLT